MSFSWRAHWGNQSGFNLCCQVRRWCAVVVTVLPSTGRYGIMLACWQGEPKERPTFPALVQILGDLLQDNSLPVSSLGSAATTRTFIRGYYETQCSSGLKFLSFPSGWEGLHPPEPLAELRRWRFLTDFISSCVRGGTENGLQHSAHKVPIHPAHTTSWVTQWKTKWRHISVFLQLHRSSTLLNGGEEQLF